MRKPDEISSDSEESQEDSHTEAIEECAKELIRAVHAQDHKAVAESLKDAFEILDAMPHEEGEHINESEQESE